METHFILLFVLLGVVGIAAMSIAIVAWTQADSKTAVGDVSQDLEVAGNITAGGRITATDVEVTGQLKGSDISANTASLTSLNVSGTLHAVVADSTASNIMEHHRHAIVSMYMKFPGGNFLGSGFFISADGYIATAAHNVLDMGAAVVSSIPRTRATTVYGMITNVNGVAGDNREVELDIVGTDGAADVAVLKPKSLLLVSQSYLHWGTARQMQPGGRIFVMGDPQGLDQQSISQGIIRDVTYIHALSVECVLFDASVLGGNSGGPFVDSNGNVIGITTFGLAGSETLVGGVSQHMAEPIVKSIIATQTDYVKAYTGWHLRPMSLSIKEYLRANYPPGDSTSDGDGQMILSYLDGAISDVPVGSVITRVDNTLLNQLESHYKDQLTNLTWLMTPGQTLVVYYRDASNSFTATTKTVTLGTFPVGYEVPIYNAASSPATLLRCVAPV